MKKLIALLLVAVMCFSLVACGGNESQTDNSGSQQGQNGNKGENKSTVISVENWNNYLELVVETKVDAGFLDYDLYLKAKEGVVISNEINTTVHFSYNMNKQHYTLENNKVILGTCESIEDTYTTPFAMYRNQNKKEYCEEIDYINGNEFSFTDGDRWTMIPNNFVITKIEGTIVAE